MLVAVVVVFIEMSSSFLVTSVFEMPGTHLDFPPSPPPFRTASLQDALVLAASATGECLSALVLGQELQLAAVDGAAALPSNLLHGILVLHAQLDESHRHQDGRASQSGHAVNSHTFVLAGAELGAQEVQPFVHDLSGGRGTVGKGQLGETHAQLVGAVGWVCGADQVGHAVLLQDLGVVRQGCILRLFRDKEPHGLVLDLGRRRPDDLVGRVGRGWSGGGGGGGGGVSRSG
jgi:hypothetical protein